MSTHHSNHHHRVVVNPEVFAPSGANQLQWRRVDSDAIHTLYNTFVSDPIAQPCYHALENRLLASGILFTTKDYSVVASEQFQNHIDTHFVNFVKEALRQLIVMGFCFFYIENDVPFVIPLGLADIRYAVDKYNFKIHMAVFREGENMPAQNIYSIIEHTVTPDGSIVSTMATYLRVRSIADCFMRNAMVADQLNAQPTIYTMSATDAVFDERDIHGIGEVDGLRASLTQKNMQTRAKLAVNSVDYNQSLVNALNASGEAKLIKIDQSSGLPHFDADLQLDGQRVVPLPLDARVASAPRAQARADIVSIMAHYESLACVVFGVNSESIGANLRSGGHLGAATLERVNLVTHESTQRWSRIVEPALLKIYNVIWGGTDEEEEMVNEETMFQKTTKKDITVVFPSTLPRDFIERLYNMRILKHSAYTKYLGQILQMPVSNFEKDHRGEMAQPNNGQQTKLR